MRSGITSTLPTWKKTRESVHARQFDTFQYINPMRFELTGKRVAVNLVVAYAPTEANLTAQTKEELWK